MCAERCPRLGPAGQAGARPGPPPLPKPQQLEEEARDGEGGAPSPSAAVGPKAIPEARPHVPTKPPLPGRPQELASPPTGRPTPAPRKASDSAASTPPTPRPRSSLQQGSSAEKGASSGLVNGERGCSWGCRRVGIEMSTCIWERLGLGLPVSLRSLIPVTVYL